MHARILSATLKQDMIAIGCPSLCERGLNDGASMALAPPGRVRNYILKKCVTLPAPQQIWSGNQHTCRRNLGSGLRDEDGHTVAI